MTSISLVDNEFAAWDEIRGGVSLAVSFFTNERPLRGTAGLVDWRLCGRLSRLIMRERIVGELRDVLMMPAGRRLPFDRIFCFGLGKSQDFAPPVFDEALASIFDVLGKAGVDNLALQLPGRATDAISARDALRRFVGFTASLGHIRECFVLEAASESRGLDALLYGRGPAATTEPEAGAATRLSTSH